MKYNKINTLYERDGRGKIVSAKLTRPVYGTINKWLVTEKVNGTNTRITYTHINSSEVEWEIGGRTDDADMTDKLVNHTTSLAIASLPTVTEIMGKFGLDRYTLYGEGYGANIHRGGRYRQDNGFVLFDIAVNDSQLGQIYLSDNLVTEAAETLDIPRVPLLNSGDPMTVEEIVELVRHGYASDVAEKFDPSFMAEGIVARPVEPLYDNRKKRVMFKLKAEDFK